MLSDDTPEERARRIAADPLVRSVALVKAITNAIRSAEAAAHRAGQEAMRERSAAEVDAVRDRRVAGADNTDLPKRMRELNRAAADELAFSAAAIRALPIANPEAEETTRP